jgi:hypothetical protein
MWEDLDSGYFRDGAESQDGWGSVGEKALGREGDWIECVDLDEWRYGEDLAPIGGVVIVGGD